MDLEKKLSSLRSKMAQAAQRVIDEWQQDEEGYDEELGAGGACDQVCEAIRNVIAPLDGVEITEGGHPGDDHAYLIAYDDDEAFAVDIPPYVYEEGGGYSWKKKPDVKISPDHIVIEKVDREFIPDWD